MEKKIKKVLQTLNYPDILNYLIIIILNLILKKNS